MKRTILILKKLFFISMIILAINFVNANYQEGNPSVLIYKNGVAFLPNEDTPYTGKFEMYYSNKRGCLHRSIDFSSDSLHSESFVETAQEKIIGDEVSSLVIWLRKLNNMGKDQKCIEENYVNGKINGLVTQWRENGQKEKEANYKDGKLNGLSMYWWENGNKGSESNYENGKENGLQISWQENGQILYVVNYINGKLDDNSHKNKNE
jgi:antitoxin component YwqK of YwqJK toxin-antitoxin module